MRRKVGSDAPRPLDLRGRLGGIARAPGEPFLAVGVLATVIALFLPWARLVALGPSAPRELTLTPLAALSQLAATSSGLALFASLYLVGVVLMVGAGALLLRVRNRRFRRVLIVIFAATDVLIVRMLLYMPGEPTGRGRSGASYTATLQYGYAIACVGAIATALGLALVWIEGYRRIHDATRRSRRSAARRRR